MTSDDVIALLDLLPLTGEGGYYRQTWVSTHAVGAELAARYGRDKPAGTAIYYLVTHAPDGFSAIHRLPTDEIFHFYLGDPVEQLLLFPDGRGESIVLGQDLRAGERVQQVVPAGVWQGTRLRAGGRWALLGTTMAPGFDPADLEIGVRADLLRRYPTHAEAIERLTRTR